MSNAAAHLNSKGSSRVCRDCGFRVVVADKCPLCGAPTVSADALPSQAQSGTSRQEGIRLTFSLSALLMFFTLWPVCFGIIVAAPGLGIPLTVLAVLVMMALVRSSAAAARDESSGKSIDRAAKFARMVISFGLIVLVVIAGAIAFLAASIGVCEGFAATGLFPNPRPGRDEMSLPLSDTGITVAFVVAGGVAFLLVVGLLWLTWPRRRRPHR
jgi:hypothetical protein